MILTITTTHSPARELGFLLYKHPDRCQSFDISMGTVHVTYPEATADRCTAAMILDVDPVGLVRGRGETLSQYVNDRPYVASSMMSVALAQVMGTALSGTCKERPELADTPIPLTARLSVVPVRGQRSPRDQIARLFEPLGYDIEVVPHERPADGSGDTDSPYVTLTLANTTRLCDLLRHLYILMPVLDNEKHYFVGEEEVEKMMRYGDGWLADHPERRFITRRYLQFGSVIREGLERLRDADEQGADEQDPTDRDAAPEAPPTAGENSGDASTPNASTPTASTPTASTPNASTPNASTRTASAGPTNSAKVLQRPERLNTLRLEKVLLALRVSGARSVLDLGCGEGKLINRLLFDDRFERITGVDVALSRLQRADERLDLGQKPPAIQEKVQLYHGSLLYNDRRLTGYDAAALVEVIEHVEAHRLPDLERSVFGFAHPKTVIVTTPNAEFNALFGDLDADARRHEDHRFEWTRDAFAEWAGRVADTFRYRVAHATVGPVDRAHGAPTQMAVFQSVRSAEENPNEAGEDASTPA